MTALVSAITAVFTALGTWIVSLFGLLTGIFWDATTSSLTFVGTVSIMALGVGIILLFVYLVKSFLSFR